MCPSCVAWLHSLRGFVAGSMQAKSHMFWTLSGVETGSPGSARSWLAVPRCPACAQCPGLWCVVGWNEKDTQLLDTVMLHAQRQAATTTQTHNALATMAHNKHLTQGDATLVYVYEKKKVQMWNTCKVRVNHKPNDNVDDLQHSRTATNTTNVLA